MTEPEKADILIQLKYN